VPDAGEGAGLRLLQAGPAAPVFGNP